MGKLLEFDIETLTRRSYFSDRLSPYYLRTSVRLYYLLEHIGPEHLMKTTKMTLANIKELSSAEFDDLVIEMMRIFNGVENLGGE
jgi:hypothetical protein